MGVEAKVLRSVQWLCQRRYKSLIQLWEKVQSTKTSIQSTGLPGSWRENGRLLHGRRQLLRTGRTWETRFISTSRKDEVERDRAMWMDKLTFCLSSFRIQMCSQITSSSMNSLASSGHLLWQPSSLRSQSCIALPKTKQSLIKSGLSLIKSQRLSYLIRANAIMMTLMRLWQYRHASIASTYPGSFPRF